MASIHVRILELDATRFNERDRKIVRDPSVKIVPIIPRSDAVVSIEMR